MDNKCNILLFVLIFIVGSVCGACKDNQGKCQYIILKWNESNDSSSSIDAQSVVQTLDLTVRRDPNLTSNPNHNGTTTAVVDALEDNLHGDDGVSDVVKKDENVGNPDDVINEDDEGSRSDYENSGLLLKLLSGGVVKNSTGIVNGSEVGNEDGNGLVVGEESDANIARSLQEDDARPRGKPITQSSDYRAHHDIKDPGMKIVIVTGIPRDRSNRSLQGFPVTSPPRTKSKGPVQTFITVFLLSIAIGGCFVVLIIALYPHCKRQRQQRRERRGRGEAAGKTAEREDCSVCACGPWSHRQTKRSKSGTKTKKDKKRAENTYYVSADLLKYEDNNYVTSDSYRKRPVQTTSMLSFGVDCYTDDDDDDLNDEDTCSVPFTPVSERAPSPIATTINETPTMTPKRAKSLDKGHRSQQEALSADSGYKKLPRTSTHRYNSNKNNNNNKNNSNNNKGNNNKADDNSTENHASTQSSGKTIDHDTATTNNTASPATTTTSSWPSWDDSGLGNGKGSRCGNQSRGDRQITQILNSQNGQKGLNRHPSTSSSVGNKTAISNRKTKSTNNINNKISGANIHNSKTNAAKNNNNNNNNNNNTLNNNGEVRNGATLNKENEDKIRVHEFTSGKDEDRNLKIDADNTAARTSDKMAATGKDSNRNHNGLAAKSPVARRFFNESFTPTKKSVRGLFGSRQLYFINPSGRAPVASKDEISL